MVPFFWGKQSAYAIFGILDLLWLGVLDYASETHRVKWLEALKLWGYIAVVAISEDLLVISSLVPFLNLATNWALIMMTVTFDVLIEKAMREIVVRRV